MMGWIYALILAAIVSASAFGGYTAGEHHVQGEWDKQKLADSQATNKALVDRNAAIATAKTQHEEDTKLLKKGFSNEIDTIHAGYAKSGRLLFRSGTCERFTPDPKANSPAGSDGGNAETWVFSGPVEQGLKSLGQEIEEKFAACRVAQDFIRKNGMAP